MKPTRTFIAIDPGNAIRDRLVSLQEKLAKTGADVKWVEHDNLHLTLLFLGEVGQRDLVGVCRAVGDAATKQTAFPMTIEGVARLSQHAPATHALGGRWRGRWGSMRLARCRGIAAARAGLLPTRGTWLHAAPDARARQRRL